MSEGSALQGVNRGSTSCWHTIIKSKWTDTALITGFVALLVIGILASTGLFNSMGTTHAAHLSYGMYGGAAFLLLAEIVKRAIHYYSKDASSNEIKTNNPPVRRSPPLDQEGMKNLMGLAESSASRLSEQTPGRTKEQATEDLKKFIFRIIVRPDFQNDPVRFVESWADERSREGENAIIPDDQALSFFKGVLGLKNPR